MALNILNKEGIGGNANTPALDELQGFRVSLVTGASADTKIDIANIRSADTIVSAINNNAGTLTDVTGTMSINTLKASGTLTAVSAVDTDVFTVNDVVYTISTSGGSSYQEVAVGSDNTEMGDNMTVAINGYEGSYAGSNEVTVSNIAGVVTITANVEGTGGNAITIASVDSTITASGATLAGGSDTGGVQSTGATDQLLIHWFDKQA